MSDVVDRLINGFFEYESEKLVFSAHKIEETVMPGDQSEGSFLLSSRGGKRVKGRVCSPCMRMTVITPEFDDSEYEIRYSFDAKGLEPGAIVKGDIQIISEAGEYFIPFTYSVVRTLGISGNEGIKNLFHFSNHAQTDWKNAVKAFYSDDFLTVFDGNDRVHLEKYRGFSNERMDEENVDRFLVSVKKKHTVEFKTDSALYEFEDIKSDLLCSLSIKKTTWGYIDLCVKTEAGFIELKKDRINGGDFLGNLCTLEFVIKEEALHEGKNFAHLVFSLPDGTKKLSVDIIAKRREGSDPEKLKRRELNRLRSRLMQRYTAFRMKQIGKDVWIKESLKVVERMNALNEKNPESRLYQAQLLIMENRVNEARWILEHVEREMKIKQRGEELYCYFLYLAALLNREEDYIDSITAQIKGIYEKKRSFRILWLLFYLDADYARSPSKKIAAIKKEYDKGARSPLLYIEAYNCYASNPSLFSELTGFEISVLYFAIKNYKLESEILEKLLGFSEKLKSAPGILYKIFTLAYKMNENKDEVPNEPLLYNSRENSAQTRQNAAGDIARTVCALLIKDNITDEEAFGWYRKGVERDLKITRLYEYYMYSVPFDHKIVIPKPIVLYFNISSNLSYERTAFLYANLIRHKGRQDELYENSLSHIRAFAESQIMEERIDRNLAIIYKNVFVVQMITPKLAKHFLRILFAYEMGGIPKDIAYVVVIEEELRGERKYPVQYGFAYPVIYSHNFTVFLEDHKGKRTVGDPLRLHRLMDDSVYLDEVRGYVGDVPGFCLYICTVRNRYVYVDSENVDYCRLLVNSDEVIDSYKADIRIGLMRYYYDNGEMTPLDNFLMETDTSRLKAGERAEYIDYLVRRGMYERAYDTIKRYGAEEVPAKICVRICSQMIAVHDDVSDPAMLKFAYYAFTNGKYDLLTLKYLVENYRGLTKELRNLWRAANRFELECCSLMEELLVQMMYTRASVLDKEDLFEAYVKERPGSRVELAYISYQAYEYFARERILGETVFSEIIKNFQKGEELNDACKLALLKHYAEDDAQMTPRISEMLSSFLIEFLHRNIYYNFFREYKDILPELSSYEDKTVIEYRANPSHRVVLHYLLEDSEDTEDRYYSEEMKCRFGGIFSREFILFFGENLQYYITEESEGEEKLTFSDSVRISETISGDDSSRYHILNDMGVAKSLKDENTLIDLMKEYARKDYFTENAFSVI